MKERDYILASNKTNLRIITECLRDILPGPEYGVSEEELNAINVVACKMLTKAFSLINIDN